MAQNTTESADEWTRSTLDKAVRDISDLGVIPDEILGGHPRKKGK